MWSGAGWTICFRQREQLERTSKFKFLEVVQDAVCVAGRVWGADEMGLLVRDEAGEASRAGP